MLNVSSHLNPVSYTLDTIATDAIYHYSTGDVFISTPKNIERRSGSTGMLKNKNNYPFQVTENGTFSCSTFARSNGVLELFVGTISGSIFSVNPANGSVSRILRNSGKGGEPMELNSAAAIANRVTSIFCISLPVDHLFPNLDYDNLKKKQEEREKISLDNSPTGAINDKKNEAHLRDSLIFALIGSDKCAIYETNSGIRIHGDKLQMPADVNIYSVCPISHPFNAVQTSQGGKVSAVPIAILLGAPKGVWLMTLNFIDTFDQTTGITSTSTRLFANLISDEVVASHAVYLPSCDACVTLGPDGLSAFLRTSSEWEFSRIPVRLPSLLRNNVMDDTTFDDEESDDEENRKPHIIKSGVGKGIFISLAPHVNNISTLANMVDFRAQLASETVLDNYLKESGNVNSLSSLIEGDGNNKSQIASILFRKMASMSDDEIKEMVMKRFKVDLNSRIIVSFTDGRIGSYRLNLAASRIITLTQVGGSSISPTTIPSPAMTYSFIKVFHPSISASASVVKQEAMVAETFKKATKNLVGKSNTSKDDSTSNSAQVSSEQSGAQTTDNQSQESSAASTAIKLLKEMDIEANREYEWEKTNILNHIMTSQAQNGLPEITTSGGPIVLTVRGYLVFKSQMDIEQSQNSKKIDKKKGETISEEELQKKMQLQQFPACSISIFPATPIFKPEALFNMALISGMDNVMKICLYNEISSKDKYRLAKSYGIIEKELFSKAKKLVGPIDPVVNESDNVALNSIIARQGTMTDKRVVKALNEISQIVNSRRNLEKEAESETPANDSINSDQENWTGIFSEDIENYRSRTKALKKMMATIAMNINCENVAKDIDDSLASTPEGRALHEVMENITNGKQKKLTKQQAAQQQQLIQIRCSRIADATGGITTGVYVPFHMPTIESKLYQTYVELEKLQINFENTVNSIFSLPTPIKDDKEKAINETKEVIKKSANTVSKMNIVGQILSKQSNLLKSKLTSDLFTAAHIFQEVANETAKEGEYTVTAAANSSSLSSLQNNIPQYFSESQFSSKSIRSKIEKFHAENSILSNENAVVRIPGFEPIDSTFYKMSSDYYLKRNAAVLLYAMKKNEEEFKKNYILAAKNYNATIQEKRLQTTNDSAIERAVEEGVYIVADLDIRKQLNSALNSAAAKEVSEDGKTVEAQTNIVELPTTIAGKRGVVMQKRIIQKPPIVKINDDEENMFKKLKLLQAENTARCRVLSGSARTLSLRSFDKCLSSLQTAVTNYFPICSVVNNRYVILPFPESFVDTYTNKQLSKIETSNISYNKFIPAYDLQTHSIIGARRMPGDLSGPQFVTVYRLMKHRNIFSYIGHGSNAGNQFFVFTESPYTLRQMGIEEVDEENIKREVKEEDEEQHNIEESDKLVRLVDISEDVSVEQKLVEPEKEVKDDDTKEEEKEPAEEKNEEEKLEVKEIETTEEKEKTEEVVEEENKQNDEEKEEIIEKEKEEIDSKEEIPSENAEDKEEEEAKEEKINEKAEEEDKKEEPSEKDIPIIMKEITTKTTTKKITTKFGHIVKKTDIKRHITKTQIITTQTSYYSLSDLLSFLFPNKPSEVDINNDKIDFEAIAAPEFSFNEGLRLFNRVIPDIRTLLHVITTLVDALTFIHSEKINLVHRDLRPSQIWIKTVDDIIQTEKRIDTETIEKVTVYIKDVEKEKKEVIIKEDVFINGEKQIIGDISEKSETAKTEAKESEAKEESKQEDSVTPEEKEEKEEESQKEELTNQKDQKEEEIDETEIETETEEKELPKASKTVKNDTDFEHETNYKRISIDSKIFHIGFMTTMQGHESVENRTIWSAPEVVCTGISNNSDIWSIGTILFRLIQCYTIAHASDTDRSRLMLSSEYECVTFRQGISTKLFCPRFHLNDSRIPKWPNCPTDPNHILNIANNASIVQAMAELASDRKLFGDKYLIYSNNEAMENALSAVRIQISRYSQSYCVAGGKLPWDGENIKAGLLHDPCMTTELLLAVPCMAGIIPKQLLEVISACWVFDVNRRPSSLDLQKILTNVTRVLFSPRKPQQKKAVEKLSILPNSQQSQVQIQKQVSVMIQPQVAIQQPIPTVITPKQPVPQITEPVHQPMIITDPLSTVSTNTLTDPLAITSTPMTQEIKQTTTEPITIDPLSMMAPIVDPLATIEKPKKQPDTIIDPLGSLDTLLSGITIDANAALAPIDFNADAAANDEFLAKMSSMASQPQNTNTKQSVQIQSQPQSQPQVQIKKEPVPITPVSPVAQNMNMNTTLPNIGMMRPGMPNMGMNMNMGMPNMNMNMGIRPGIPNMNMGMPNMNMNMNMNMGMPNMGMMPMNGMQNMAMMRPGMPNMGMSMGMPNMGMMPMNMNMGMNMNTNINKQNKK